MTKDLIPNDYADWRFLLASSYLKKSKTIDLFLPPGFQKGSPLPLLVLHDGQDAKALKLKEQLHLLWKQGVILPFLVVAVHADQDRMHEYGVAGEKDFAGRGSRADRYMRCLLEEILPKVSRFFDIPGSHPQNTIAGMSLGGLSAFDIAWEQPHVFSQIGVFSGSFWWRRRDLNQGYTPYDRILIRKISQPALAKPLRFWFEVGSNDETADRNQSGMIDAIEDTLDVIQVLRYKGYRLHRDIRYLEIQGGRHDHATWAKALPDFLHWAFGKPIGR
jgi:enterochelin esterase-like enzyme